MESLVSRPISSRRPQVFGSIGAILVAASLLFPSFALAERPTMPSLTEKQQARVDDGKLVLLTESAGGEGKKLVTGIIRIEAEADEIWPIVLSNKSIRESSKAIREVNTYKDETTAGVRDLRLAYLLKVGWSEIRYHSARRYKASDGYMTWVLDKEKENDIRWTEGSYSTWPAGGSKGTIFLYKARIETGKAVPEWLEEELTQSSLRKYLVYIKKIAED